MKIVLRFVVAALFLTGIGFAIYFFAFNHNNEALIVSGIDSYTKNAEDTNLNSNFKILKDKLVEVYKGKTNFTDSDVTKNAYLKTLKNLNANVFGIDGNKDSRDVTNYENLTNYYNILKVSGEILNHYGNEAIILKDVSNDSRKNITATLSRLKKLNKKLSDTIINTYNHLLQFVKDDSDGTLLGFFVNKYSDLEVEFRNYIKEISKLNIALENLIIKNVYESTTDFTSKEIFIHTANKVVSNFSKVDFGNVDLSNDETIAKFSDELFKCAEFIYPVLNFENIRAKAEFQYGYNTFINSYSRILAFEKKTNKNDLKKNAFIIALSKTSVQIDDFIGRDNGTDDRVVDNSVIIINEEILPHVRAFFTFIVCDCVGRELKA